MRYRYFEWIVLAVGTIAVLGTVAVSNIGGNLGWPTIVGELLVLPVLAAAVHWGRNGGFLAAALTLVAYVVLIVVVVAHSSGLEAPMIQLVLLLAIAYGAVGVVGGEICGRMKYQLARVDGGSALDADTSLYSEAVVRGLLESSLARFRRYSTAFSIIVITLPAGPFASIKPLQRRSLLRRTADRVRGDVRLVDDVGRLDDGRIVVMLPSTTAEGAWTVAGRLAAVVSDALEIAPDGVGLEVLSSDIDADAVERFCGTLIEGAGPAEEISGDAA
jgi:GGDEF domain-containing protein